MPKIVKRFKGRSRTQQFLFLGVGLVFILVIGSFAGLFSSSPNGGDPKLTMGLTPRSGADYEYDERDVIIRAEASIYPTGASIIEFTVFFWKEGSTPVSVYRKTWTASQNELVEVFQLNKGKLSEGTYNVRLVVKVSENIFGGETQTETNQFTVTEPAPIITQGPLGDFEAPSFTLLPTIMILGFLFLFKKFIYRSRYR